MLIGEHQTQVAFYTLMLSYCPNLKASSTLNKTSWYSYKHFVKLHVLRADVSLVKSDTYNYIPGLLVGRGKTQISRDFQSQIQGQNILFCGNFGGKFCWQMFVFPQIWQKFLMEIDRNFEFCGSATTWNNLRSPDM